MKLSLSRLNTLLVIAIVIINGYIIAMPTLPALIFWLNNDPATVKKLEQTVTGSETSSSQTAAVSQNQLIIPSMQLTEPVIGGSSAKALNSGVWLRPQGTTPDKAGNTVIAGHRFTYTDPQGSFYHLDKVRPGDHIGLFWEGKRYTYTVTETKVVPASQTSIEGPSDKPRLTLYTCTPLWLPKERLVVIAEEATL